MAQFIKVFNHGKNPIDLTHLENPIHFSPKELHFKANGTLNGKPSLVMVMEDRFKNVVWGEFSLNSLMDCLDELGYEIIEKK